MDIFELGEKVKAERKAKKMSQATLAALTGFSRSHVEEFENGKTPEIAYTSVLRIMNAVGLDLRSATYNQGRPTLDDLMEEEEPDAPRMGR